MLTIGVDSYVSTLEADEYISVHYTSYDAQRSTWEALKESDKEIFLRNAAVAMNNIKFSGIKLDSDQMLSFPRCYKNASYYPLSWYECKKIDDYYWYCQSEAPEEVKYSQIEEALEMASPSESSADYEVLNGAVKSYSISGISETFKDIPVSTSGTVQTELFSKKAQKLLCVYTGGSYRVN